MHRRRTLIILLLSVVALLGVVLFASVRPSSVFRIAAPPVKPAPTSQIPAGISTTLSGPLKNVSGTTLLENPRYTGQDAAGRNWTVQAEAALQGGSATTGVYILQQVTAEWQDPQQDSPLRISATEGRYNQTSASIALSGNVQATGMGLTLTAPQMDADLTTRNISATGGSRVSGLVGGWNVDLTAPTLTADTSRSILLFSGGVHAKLTPVK